MNSEPPDDAAPDRTKISGDVPFWVRFGPKAKEAMYLACSEARNLREKDLATEHLLLALTQLSEGGTAVLFESLGVDRTQVNSEIRRQVILSDSPIQPLTLTPHLRRAVWLAENEATLLNSMTVETKHLLLGLIREDEGLAGQVLAEANISIEKAREACKRLAAEDIEPTKPEPKERIGMWQRFTERARRVVFFAQEEAGRLGENHVATEHMLLGLVRENDSVAARILDRLGVRLARIRSEIERQVARGDGRLSPDMQLTPRVKRVIDLSYDEARMLSNNYIGTEHLLLGLVREGEGMAGRVLNKLGVTLDKTREEVIRLQAEDPKMTSARQRATAAVSGDYAMNIPFGHLGVARAFDGRASIEVAMDAAAFGLLIDIFVAKDAHGYHSLTEGDQTVFLLPSGTPLKALVPPIGSGKVALSEGRYVRVLEGIYAGYAGWIFRDCFENVGADDAPFPPPIESKDTVEETN